jgi:eukaryotic-like serine/threonine-protein kinase
VQLSHCMMVKGDSADSSPGYALAMRLGAGFGARMAKNAPIGRNLEIDHCTITGEGLLSFEGFTAQSPLTVNLKDTVVQTRALLRWKMGADAGFPQGLKWSGEGNRYDVSGDAWVVLPPRGGASLVEGVPDGPSGFDGWVKAMPSETDSKAEEIRFPGGSTIGGDRGPKDFAVAEAGKGADIARVGPRLAPGKP